MLTRSAAPTAPHLAIRGVVPSRGRAGVLVSLMVAGSACLALAGSAAPALAASGQTAHPAEVGAPIAADREGNAATPGGASATTGEADGHGLPGRIALALALLASGVTAVGVIRAPRRA